MSEIVGRLNRTIEAQGPDKLWVDSRDALQTAYDTISDLHAERRALVEAVAAAKADALREAAAELVAWIADDPVTDRANADAADWLRSEADRIEADRG